MGIDAGALYIITLGFGNQGVSNRVRNIEKWLYWPCLGVFRVFFGLSVQKWCDWNETWRRGSLGIDVSALYVSMGFWPPGGE